MTKLANDNDFDKYINNAINRQLIGEALARNIGKSLEIAVGKPTKLSNSIYYKVENDEITVYSETPIPRFIEEGTKPHIIRPKKPGGALAFESGQVSSYKNGKKINFKDKVVVKEVKHPGTKPNPFIRAGMFIARKEIENKIFK